MKWGVSDQTRWSSMLTMTPSAPAGRATAMACIRTMGAREVGFEVVVPGGAGRIVPLVAFEGAGIVDQDADGAEGGGRVRDEPDDSGLVGEVGVEDRGATAGPFDIGGGGMGGVATGVAVDGDGEAGVGELHGHGEAEPLAAAGDEGGGGEWWAKRES